LNELANMLKKRAKPELYLKYLITEKKAFELLSDEDCQKINSVPREQFLKDISREIEETQKAIEETEKNH